MYVHMYVLTRSWWHHVFTVAGRLWEEMGIQGIEMLAMLAPVTLPE
jgi:hypothetical protein